MKKRKLIWPFLALGLSASAAFTGFALKGNKATSVAAVTNETHANGAGYYSAGKLCDVSYGWPVAIYPYTSDFEFQFIVQSWNGAWGDYAVTMLTMKIDVSQEVGTHKVYTLEGSQSGFRLFDENGDKIVEKQNDSSTTLVSSDTNSVNSLFWNRTEHNIEVRIPYKTLCGESYSGTPIIGIAAQTYYANGEGYDWAGFKKYSDPFNDLDDPSTYTRITYNPSGPKETNYTTISTAPFNFYTDKNLVEHFAEKKLLMTTYTGEGTGACLGTNGLYAKAKRHLLDLGSDCISIFRNDTDFESAVDRYETWAAFNGDTGYEYIDDFTHIKAANSIRGINILGENNVALIITLIGLAGAVAAAIGLFLVKGKKSIR